jgi:hypothetical protein
LSAIPIDASQRDLLNATRVNPMTETPLASVFSRGKFVGTILSRGPKGYEAIAESGESHGCFASQKEAAAALQQIASYPGD